MGIGHNVGLCMCRSKVLAEQKAFEMCGQQSHWSLVTIQPSVVQGPPPGMWSPLYIIICSKLCSCAPTPVALHWHLISS